MNKRWLGIDFGTRRIGLAVSDPLGIVARRLETINWNGDDSVWAVNRVAEIIQEHSIAGIVMGLPRRTDGQAGASECLARQFAHDLQIKTGMEPVLSDERYTTVLADRVLRETGVQARHKKAIIDQIAAEIILQDYLDSHRSEHR